MSEEKSTPEELRKLNNIDYARKEAEYLKYVKQTQRAEKLAAAEGEAEPDAIDLSKLSSAEVAQQEKRFLQRLNRRY